MSLRYLITAEVSQPTSTAISAPDIDKGLTAYSHDLLAELDRELSDVFPAAKDLLYFFPDAPEVLTGAHLETLLREGDMDDSDREKEQETR